MTLQGDQQSIVPSERGCAEDGLVSVRATSTTACSPARRDMFLRAPAPLLAGCPRNFGWDIPNAMARGFFRFLAISVFFRLIFRDLLFFCDKIALLSASPNWGKVVACKDNRAP